MQSLWRGHKGRMASKALQAQLEQQKCMLEEQRKHRQLEERLIRLLEERPVMPYGISPPSPGDFSEEQMLAHTTKVAGTSAEPVRPHQAGPHPKHLRPELLQLQQQLREMQPSAHTVDLQELINGGELEDIIQTGAVDRAKELSYAAGDASKTGLLSKGRQLLEGRTNLECAG